MSDHDLVQRKRSRSEKDHDPKKNCKDRSLIRSPGHTKIDPLFEILNLEI